jgi:hypothetical protein
MKTTRVSKSPITKAGAGQSVKTRSVHPAVPENWKQIVELLRASNRLDDLVIETRALLFIFERELAVALKGKDDHIAHAVCRGLNARICRLDSELSAAVERQADIICQLSKTERRALAAT